MTKRDKMYMEIRRHGENLKRIFGLDCDSIKLAKAIFRLENKAHRLAEAYCNGDVETREFEKLKNHILTAVNKITGYKEKGIPVFLNGDPRGYTLKIKDDYARGLDIYKDWGGYGILAPNFREV